MMNYTELRKLKAQLIEKNNKTTEELTLLTELQSLSQIIDKGQYSLALSSNVCKTCGRPL